MTERPIFVATHPRACSTAFERVFMTRRDTLECIHEPFGDAYYYGPERLAQRFMDDEKSRLDSGFSDATYKSILDRINKENTEEKRVFIKDMAQYFIPPDNGPVSIAPSLLQHKRGVGTELEAPRPTPRRRSSHIETEAPMPNLDKTNGHTSIDTPYATPAEPGNPTVVPSPLLEQFHFAFLIRHPKNSIASYYRCTIPPLDNLTGFHSYRRDEAGYNELRRLFDYLRSVGYIGPEVAGQGHYTNGVNGNHTNGASTPKVQICVIDADDMLDNPDGIISAFCKSVGIKYTPDMLNWDTEEETKFAEEAFEKWKGFHEDAIQSKDLKPRQHKKTKTDEQYYAEWVEKYGEEAAKVIKQSAEENVADYEYLKQFAVKV